MTRLSVNINRWQSLRNARGGDVPNVVKVALDCEDFLVLMALRCIPSVLTRGISAVRMYMICGRFAGGQRVQYRGYPAPEFMDLVLKVKTASGNFGA